MQGNELNSRTFEVNAGTGCDFDISDFGGKLILLHLQVDWPSYSWTVSYFLWKVYANVFNCFSFIATNITRAGIVADSVADYAVAVVVVLPMLLLFFYCCDGRLCLQHATF